MEQRDANQVSAALQLFELAPRITRMENAILGESPLPLTFRQYRLLSRIDEGLATITQLGRIATISLPAISESVERLVKKGMVDRAVDPNNRRAVNLSLTAKGHEALGEGERLLAAAAEVLLEDIAPTRRVRLESDLKRIGGKVAEQLGPGAGDE